MARRIVEIALGLLFVFVAVAALSEWQLYCLSAGEDRSGCAFWLQ
jgi:hypothetical protein